MKKSATHTDTMRQLPRFAEASRSLGPTAVSTAKQAIPPCWALSPRILENSSSDQSERSILLELPGMLLAVGDLNFVVLCDFPYCIAKLSRFARRLRVSSPAATLAIGIVFETLVAMYLL